MKHKLYSLFFTALLGMWGMQTWAQELSTTEIDGVTYYEIGSAADLVAFADLVNDGEPSANAVLTADIDLPGATATGNWLAPIGYNGVQYTGIFDGQGHAITNFEYEATDKYNGLFGYVNGGTVKNFSISGTLTSSFDKNGVVGNLNGSAVVSGIHSSLTINVSECKAHSGGIVGGCETNCSPLIEGCEYSGTLTHSGLGDCQAGIVGYTYGGTIRNCIFSGTIIGESNKYGGILGYCKVPSFGGVQNCLSIGKIIADEGCTTAAAIIANWNGDKTANVTNNYYCLQEGSTTTIAIGNKGANCEAPVLVTPEQLASGEVCFKLNANQPVIAFYQTLPDDVLPVLDASHARVYMNGHIHCNGDTYEDGTIFSNQDQGIIQDDHDFVDGICSYCGLFNENFFSPNADGFYEIANANQLLWFEGLVNGGTYDANAILTADIALTKSWTTPIGTSDAKAYKGIFDGQGHKITGFDATSSGIGGFFGATNGATIQNFSISGTLTATAGTGSGVVGYPANSRIANIHSTLAVTVPVNGVHHVGGVIGSARGGNTIDGCSFSGTMTVAVGSTDNFAGVVAYIGGDSVANCANYGTVTFADAGCAAGGVVGYLNNTTSYIRNCLNIGAVVCEAENPKYGGAIVGRIKNNWSSERVVNNYWLAGSAYGPARKDDGSSPAAASEEGTSASELASGEICWQLNEGVFIEPLWRQAIDEDAYPVPYGEGPVVYQTPTGYECVSADDPDSFEPFRDGVIANEVDFIEDADLVAYQELVDNYKNAIESWKNINNYDDFIAAYKASVELKEAVKASAAKYAEYKKTCEDAGNYLDENNITGEMSDILKAYLNENIEPNSNYPNGSYIYIMDNCNLDVEALSEEILLVEKMLEYAISGGIMGGTEITRLLTNADFANAFDGWTTEAEGSALASGGEKEVMPIVRGLGNGTFDVSQTLSELPNGIYMATVNGMFRSGNEINSKFYAGQFYMNGTANYVMSPGDSVMTYSKAIPGENCLGDDGDAVYIDDHTEGYVPSSMKGCSYAFKAGRYLNYCATEVTDGTLAIGVRSLGTGSDGDWLPFSNMRLWYLGTAEEASKKLDDVLKDFSKRAQAIVNFEGSEYEDYALYPYVFEDLKTQLSGAIAAAKSADTGEKKMALIGTFSELFNEVHACRKAYIAMFEASDKLFDLIDMLWAAELITEDEYYDWQDKVYAAKDHYKYGDISAADALALSEEMDLFAKLLPSVDGVYQLATVDQLRLFSTIVNSGQNDAKAVLTADIDMTDVYNFEPIGSSGYHFMGEFDGQGHAITNFTYEASGDYNGLFGYVENGTVKNFSISGTLTSVFNKNGVVGNLNGTAVVSGIKSSMDMNISACNGHSGGIVGGCETNCKPVIENCEYSGTMTHEGDGDCQAGIIGYTYTGTIRNCVFSGIINANGDSNSKYGGILGYCKVPSFGGIQNCLSIGQINAPSNTSGAIIAQWNGDKTENVVNNYYMLPEGTSENVVALGGKSANCEAPVNVTAEQLASGEVCYKLNGDQTEINWYETLGEDAYPVPFSTHKQVWLDGETYTNVEPGGSIEGDLNGDEKVDIADAVAVLEVMARDGNDPEADLNGDGKVDIADFVAVLEIMAKQ